MGIELDIKMLYLEIKVLNIIAIIIVFISRDICTESHDDLHTIVNGDSVHGRASTVGGHYSDGVLGIVGDIGDDYASV